VDKECFINSNTEKVLNYYIDELIQTSYKTRSKKVKNTTLDVLEKFLTAKRVFHEAKR